MFEPVDNGSSLALGLRMLYVVATEVLLKGAPRSKLGDKDGS
jgi:hypothetical protein